MDDNMTVEVELLLCSGLCKEAMTKSTIGFDGSEGTVWKDANKVLETRKEKAQIELLPLPRTVLMMLRLKDRTMPAREGTMIMLVVQYWSEACR